MDIFFAEVIGTAVLIFFGTATSAAVTLDKSSAKDSGWVFIAFGWGFAVLAGAFIAAPVSGAHLNPAVSLGFLINGTLPLADFFLYVSAQLIGAFIGALLTYIIYFKHFEQNESGDLSGIFATAPTIKHYGLNILTEALGTFVLIYFIFASTQYEGLGPIYVPLLVVGIGIAIGNVTGYAINPARDFSPRLMYALVVRHKNKVQTDWKYAFVPIVGPLLGSAVATILFLALNK